MAWRDLAEKLDREVVHAFDEGGVQLQPMLANGQTDGDPFDIPAEFDRAYVDQALQDGLAVSTTRPVAWIHYADLPPGKVIQPSWRLVVLTGPNAGTYSIDSLEPNNDATGTMLRLKRARNP